MGTDEEGTLFQLMGHRQALVDPKIEEHRGRIVKSTGDGMLVEFASVVDAVRCAVEVQRGMSERNARVSVDKRIEFRVGINLGDIIIDDDDIYGDGVNIAARLEGIAEPGGICISRQAHDHLLEKLSFTCEKLGLRNLKNIAKPVEVYSVNFGSVSMTQETKYCRASDGVRIAYATVGQGLPLVKAANWMNHLEYDWESPIWHHLLEGLAKNHTLVRYDARGNGLRKSRCARIAPASAGANARHACTRRSHGPDRCGPSNCGWDPPCSFHSASRAESPLFEARTRHCSVFRRDQSVFD